MFKILKKGILGRLGQQFSTHARMQKNIVVDMENNAEKLNECEKGVPNVPNSEFQGDCEKSELTFEDVLKMPLSQFKEAGLLVRVRCRHLNGEEVFIASSEKEAEIGRSEGLIVYTGDELVKLVKGNPSPNVMGQIHEAKRIFQGTLIETKGRV